MAQNTFHVSLFVSDLERAVEQYRRLFGVEPARARAPLPSPEAAILAIPGRSASPPKPN